MKDESVLNISVAVARAWFWRRFFGRINVADKPAATRGSIVLLRLSATKCPERNPERHKRVKRQNFWRVSALWSPAAAAGNTGASPPERTGHNSTFISQKLTLRVATKPSSSTSSQLNPPHPPPHPRTAPRLLGTPTKRTPRPPHRHTFTCSRYPQVCSGIPRRSLVEERRGKRRRRRKKRGCTWELNQPKHETYGMAQWITSPSPWSGFCPLRLTFPHSAQEFKLTQQNQK